MATNSKSEAGIDAKAGDASREKTLEERLMSCQLEIKKLNESARSKDEFLRIVSHDLRTPLDVIRGNLDMVVEGDAGPIGEKVKEYLSDALAGADRLAALISDVLDVTRLESGRLRFTLDKVNLSELAKESETNFGNAIEKKGLRFYYHPADSPLFVYSDKEKLYEVVDNFLGNAMKFTPSGGSITLRVYREGDYGCVEVKDTGVGIAPEDLAKIFTRFPQVENAIEHAPRGVGLGLYISKQLIGRLGGKIAVHSEGLGRGSAFSFGVPLLKTDIAKDLEKYYLSLDKNEQKIANK